jgi:hypothetical protein
VPGRFRTSNLQPELRLHHVRQAMGKEKEKEERRIRGVVGLPPTLEVPAMAARRAATRPNFSFTTPASTSTLRKEQDTETSRSTTKDSDMTPPPSVSVERQGHKDTLWNVEWWDLFYQRSQKQSAEKEEQ